MITKLRNLLLCLVFVLTAEAQEVTYYCKQYTLSVSDVTVAENVTCYESKVDIEYRAGLVTITTDRLTITAQKLHGRLYSVYGDLYVFSDVRPEDGQRFVVLKPIRFNNKFVVKEKQAIEISTKQICK